MLRKNEAGDPDQEVRRKNHRGINVAVLENVIKMGKGKGTEGREAGVRKEVGMRGRGKLRLG